MHFSTPALFPTSATEPGARERCVAGQISAETAPRGPGRLHPWRRSEILSMQSVLVCWFGINEDNKGFVCAAFSYSVIIGATCSIGLRCNRVAPEPNRTWLFACLNKISIGARQRIHSFLSLHAWIYVRACLPIEGNLLMLWTWVREQQYLICLDGWMDGRVGGWEGGLQTNIFDTLLQERNFEFVFSLVILRL